MFHITKFTLIDRIYIILIELELELKVHVYCGQDKFYGPSKFGQYDKKTNRDPFLCKLEVYNVFCDSTFSRT